MSIGWIMFWKAVVLTLWASFKEARENKVDKELLRRFQEEWDRRRAKRPLMLTDQRSKLL